MGEPITPSGHPQAWFWDFMRKKGGQSRAVAEGTPGPPGPGQQHPFCLDPSWLIAQTGQYMVSIMGHRILEWSDSREKQWTVPLWALIGGEWGPNCAYSRWWGLPWPLPSILFLLELTCGPCWLPQIEGTLKHIKWLYILCRPPGYRETHHLHGWDRRNLGKGGQEGSEATGEGSGVTRRGVVVWTLGSRDSRVPRILGPLHLTCWMLISESP